MTAQLVTDALVMAIWRWEKPDALLHHFKIDVFDYYMSASYPVIGLTVAGRAPRRLR